MIDLTDYFGPDSPLQRHLPGFQPRAGQAWMAEAVAEAIAGAERLVVEAGTGTGKTFAYLLPALLSGRKTIISTGTKALQDQLYHRDLPLVGKALGRPVTAALLKGRANYLCLHRLDQVTEPAAVLQDDLQEVREWRYRTASGDRAELIEVPEDSPVWPLVTSTADNCLGQQCPDYAKCHVVKARKAAQEADLVVVNHHLLLADLAMKEEGFVEFLPGAEAIIVDEAHQLPDLAVQFFGVALGTRELERVVEELRAATLPFSQGELNRRVDALQTAIRTLRAEAPRDEGRYELGEVYTEMRDALDALSHALHDVRTAVEGLGDTSIELEKLHEQLLRLGERLAVLVSEDAWDGLRWLEVNPRSLRLHLTPLDVSTKLSGLVDTGYQAWIFTSATLAIGDDFSHFTSRMGLSGVTSLSFPSPYRVDLNGLIWLPGDLPQPSDPFHTEAMLEAVTPLLDVTAGGMFCLFTSHRALNKARKWFRSHKAALRGRKLLVQGDAPRDDLLRRFRQYGDAVLLGTGSFWEGVDVRGAALSIVAIDKLPFASPADPLMMARLEWIRREGGNGFMDHQLPLAALALKQGAGRLLRDEKDFGVVVLCDPRITGKRYGQTFLDALAPMPCAHSIDEVKSFMAAHESKGGRRMKLLAIDTSSLACSVAVELDGERCERHEEQEREHTRLLVPMIRDVIREAGLAPADLDAIVLGNGPGSFIGMRIAASVAQGLAHGTGIRIVPVSSLAAVAMEVFDHDEEAAEVVVAQDAHMGEVYLGAWRRGKPQLPEALFAECLHDQSVIDELDEMQADKRFAAGFGWQRYPQLLVANEDRIGQRSDVLYPRARYLLPLAADALANGFAIDPQDLVPAYLRSKVAEKPRAAKS